MTRLQRCLFYAVCCSFYASHLVLPAVTRAEIPVGGQVLGPDGQGLAGIQVGLEPIRPDYDRIEMRLSGDVGSDAAALTTTDDEGFFELLAPKMGPWKVVVPWAGDGRAGDVDVSTTPVYAAREHSLRPLLDPVRLPPVTLEPASMLTLRILDGNGAPVVARLGLGDQRRAQNGWRSRLRLASSGADGRVSLPRSASEQSQLALLGPNHPLLMFLGKSLEPKGDEQLIEFQLPPGVVGTVRAVDGRGRPVAGAIAYQGAGIVPLGRTDDDGRLELVVIPLEYGPPAITLMAPDLSTSYFEPRFEQDGAEGKAEDSKNQLTLTLEPRPRLRGRVVERKNRDPVAGALVWESGGGMTETDARGNYELTLFPTKAVMIQAAATGYSRARERKSLPDPDAEDAENGPTLVLSIAASFAGQVVNEDGEPVSGVLITTSLTDFTLRSRSRQQPSTRSDGQGRFFLSGLLATQGYEVLFRKPGFAPAHDKIEGLEAFEERTGLRVVLSIGRFATGWVVSENEAPVVDAEVRLVPVMTGDPRFRHVRSLMAEEENAAPSARTDAEGRFRLPNLAADRYQLEVRAAGFAPADVPGIRIEAGTGEMDLGTVVLTPGVRLEGRVLDPQGGPVAGVDIYRSREQQMVIIGRSEPKTRSDDSGRFLLKDLKEGEAYRLVAHKSGYSSEMISGTAQGGEKIEIVLRLVGAISGRVVNVDGDPVPNADVYVSAANTMAPRYIRNRSTRPARTDDQGRFRLEDLEPGEAGISVHEASYQRYEIKDLKVPSGGELSGVEIVLVRGAIVTGTVTLADGTPVVEARVVFLPALESRMGGGRPQLFAHTDGEGHYRLKGLAPGPAVIRATHGEHHQVSKGLEVAPGTQRLDLAFEPGSEVVGRVIDEDGQPVVGASMTLVLTDGVQNYFRNHLMGGEEGIRSAADGTFTFSNVQDGSYKVAATKEGYAQATTTNSVRVESQPTAPVELVLRRGISLTGRILGLELDDLAGIQVMAYNTSGRGLQQGPSRGLVDYEGRYSLANLSPGTWTVTARSEASGRQTSGQVTIAPGQPSAELDLEFKSGYSIEGVVVSAGEPQAGAQVFALGVTSGAGVGSFNATTSSDGRFRLSHLPAGSYRIHVLMGAVSVNKSFEVPADEEMVIDIRTAQVSGHVLSPSGDRPIAGASVRVEPVATASSGLGYAHLQAATTDSRGFFTLTVQDASYRVIATKGGYGPAEVTVDLEPGQQRDNLELRLAPGEGVSFSVVLDTGEVPSEVLLAVLAETQSPLVHGRFPLSDGEVRLTTVPPGTWEMLVRAGDSAVVKTSITVPGHGGQIRLPRGGALRIRIPDLEVQATTAEGFPMYAQVELTGPAGAVHYALEGHYTRSGAWPVMNGEVIATRLLPGVWTFKVNHPDGRTWTGQATVVAGTTVEVVVP